MLSIVAIKFFDISFKISILQKINNGLSFEEIMPNVQISYLLRYFNVFAYPITFLFANNFFQY
ncbi:hypothetical protein [Arcobacter sp. CECT 8985]|uniref:hypothetical protein n=1 Tax=Arcobacter sp. CECT 8985 TaxID=1935424 RepID=UPI002159F52C|nr:hypothetical protein [Arcobacter sp. CECT 8985]